MRVVACVFGSGVYFANTGRAKYLLGYVLKSVLLLGGFLGGGLAALALRGGGGRRGRTRPWPTRGVQGQRAEGGGMNQRVVMQTWPARGGNAEMIIFKLIYAMHLKIYANRMHTKELITPARSGMKA